MLHFNFAISNLDITRISLVITIRYLTTLNEKSRYVMMIILETDWKGPVEISKRTFYAVYILQKLILLDSLQFSIDFLPTVRRYVMGNCRVGG